MKLLFIDNQIDALNELITEFKKREKTIGDLNFIALLFQNTDNDPARENNKFYAENGNTSASAIRFINIHGEDELLSNGISELIQKELTTPPGDKRVLIDIYLVDHPLGDRSFDNFESVRFANKLLEEKIVELGDIFFYSYSGSLPTYLAKFRGDTDGKFNEPLGRPGGGGGMDRKSEYDRFVDRAIRKITRDGEYAE